MNLKTPFNALSRTFQDIDHIHDFLYSLPDEPKTEYWKEECERHPTVAGCKIYDV